MFYAELEEFCALSVIYKSPLAAKGGDDETGIFTCFNKLLGVTFSEILPNLKDAKQLLTTDSIVDAEIKEPRRDLLNGCYSYLSSRNEPLSLAMKRFLNSYQYKYLTDIEIAKRIPFIQACFEREKHHALRRGDGEADAAGDGAD